MTSTDAILFDYDDTLVRTRQCRFAAIKAVARRWYGVELPEERIERFWGMEYRAFFREVFSGLDDNIGRLTSRYESLDAEFPIQLHPDAQPALQALSRSYRLGIVTAVGKTLLERQLQDLDIPAGMFSVLQAAEDTLVHKPDSAVFLPSLGKLRGLRVSPEGVTYVGDSLNDWIAASGAGLRFIVVDRGSVNPEEFHQRAVRVVSSLEELVSA
jgi:phosphoglycolate phosphatase-like HAD superfamily hydrolase